LRRCSGRRLFGEPILLVELFESRSFGRRDDIDASSAHRMEAQPAPDKPAHPFRGDLVFDLLGVALDEVAGDVPEGEIGVAECLVEVADDLEHLRLGVEPPVGDELALVAVENLAKEA
jgi:hypothetical protein